MLFIPTVLKFHSDRIWQVIGFNCYATCLAELFNHIFLYYFSFHFYFLCFFLLLCLFSLYDIWNHLGCLSNFCSFPTFSTCFCWSVHFGFAVILSLWLIYSISLPGLPFYLPLPCSAAASDSPRPSPLCRCHKVISDPNESITEGSARHLQN